MCFYIFPDTDMQTVKRADSQTYSTGRETSTDSQSTCVNLA